jgi:phosphopantetheinyl transferase (holo-ACP synthase)
MNARKSTDLRFLKKILTGDEIGLVADADDPDAALWSMWACKEAAYKVIQKMDGGAAFLPRRWSVLSASAPGMQHGACASSGGDDTTGRWRSEVSGLVQIPGFHEMPFCLYLTRLYVHCIASDSERALEEALWQADALPAAKQRGRSNPSSFVRDRLADHLARLLRCSVREIEIIRPSVEGRLQAPEVYINSERAAIDISLSHDEDYTAYALLFPATE